MKQKIIDIQPGQVFEKTFGLGGRGRHLFLKLHERKVVNITSNTICDNIDLQERVTVLRHPLESYLSVGGIKAEMG